MRMARINREIGENGQQPTDYGAGFWDELKRQTSERPTSVTRTHVGANSNGEAKRNGSTGAKG